MQIIALSGRRIETEAWMKRLLAAANYPDAQILRYRHWHTNVDASVDFEAMRLAKQSPQLVIAKSLGTVIASTAYCLHDFRPAAAVLIGTPFAALEREQVQYLQRFAAGVETLFIQQAEDPGGFAKDLAAALHVTRGEVVEVAGSDHIYADTGELAAILDRWKAKHPGM